MGDVNWCKCKGHRSKNPLTLTDHYCLHFLPNGWRLEYTTLTEPEPEGSRRDLFITGYCDQCGGFMRSGVGISPEWTGKTLLAHVYRGMSHRPYDFKEASGIYHGGCVPRSQWYWEQDHLEAWQRKEQFVSLFHKEDQEAARRWAEEHIPSPGVCRDTAAGLFLSVIDLVQREGFWPEQSAFFTISPSSDPAGAKPLTDYRFDLWPELNFGGESGTFIDCVLYGTFDQSGRDRLHIGSIYTSAVDRDTCLIMGSLAGAMLYFGRQYVSDNRRRFASDAELQAESGTKNDYKEKEYQHEQM